MQNRSHQSYVRQPSTGGRSIPAPANPPAYAARTGGLAAVPQEPAPPAFVGRREVTETILAQLASGGGAGCILVGEPGSGKTALIHHVLRRCSADTYVVHVRGSAFSGRTAFGALTFLLSDLDPAVSSHPVLILRGLTQLIQERAQGRAVLLAVDNAEELDEFSAMALSQLVLSRTAGLLASFRDFSKAPAEFMGLWREGILSRVDLEPLDPAETGELLAAELHGPVSGAAVANLHKHTAGNPHLLRLACADYRQAGRLRSSGNVWVLDPRRETPPGRMAEAVLARLEGLSDRQIALIRTAALAGSLPLASALHGVAPGEVDALQESGLLAVDRESVPSIRVRDAVLARAVALSLDRGTQAALLRDLRAAAAAADDGGEAAVGEGTGGASQDSAPQDSAPQDPAPQDSAPQDSAPTDPAADILDPVCLAMWRLDAGETLDLGAAVTAARQANTAGHPARAVRFIAGLEDYQSSAAAVLELVDARMSQGEYGAALSELSSFAGPGPAPEPLEEIRLLLAEYRVLCMAATGAVAESAAGLLAGGAARKHEELLARAEERTAECAAAGTLSRSETAALEQEMILARAGCNSAHGRFLENAAYLAPLLADAAGYDNRFRVLAGSWLCEALGLTNRQDEALELASEVQRLLGVPGIGRGDLSRSFARILHVHLAVGALKQAGRLLEQHRGSDRAALFPGLSTEVAEGLLHAYAGDPDPALERLLPAVAQLRLGGPASLLPLAASATAYCLALRGDAKGAALHLQLKTKAADGGPWSVRRGTRHFAALAEASLGSPHAAQRFTDLAAHDHRRGAYAYELLALLSALRLGDRENLDRLLAVAAQQQGPFARMCETYAKGTGSFDTQLLIQAGELAEASGHVRFAREASESALAVAAGTGDRATVRFIHRSRRGTVAPRVPEGPDSADEYLSALTFRERAIARMAAAGSSNKAIAAELNISVRTVEGHLYQVYSKLHVGSRRELGKIIADKAGAAK